MSTETLAENPPIGWREHWEDNGDGRYDETWDGEVIMAPLPNDEHQDLQAGILTALYIVTQTPKLGKVRAGVNVTDRHDDWRQNYRGPDVVVYLNGNLAINKGSHWTGGPDFLVEIISPTEDPLAKLEFYAGVGTREVLTVEREPWALELFKLKDGELVSSGRATPDSGSVVQSEAVGLTFSLESSSEVANAIGGNRPRVRIALPNKALVWWA